MKKIISFLFTVECIVALIVVLWPTETTALILVMGVILIAIVIFIDLMAQDTKEQKETDDNNETAAERLKRVRVIRERTDPTKEGTDPTEEAEDEDEDEDDDGLLDPLNPLSHFNLISPLHPRNPFNPVSPFNANNILRR